MGNRPLKTKLSSMEGNYVRTAVGGARRLMKFTLYQDR